MEYDKTMVFVGMSFGSDPISKRWSHFAWKAIKDVCEVAGLKACRADETAGSEAFVQTVERSIDRCWYAVFDLTGERPNVYYELGWADAHGHPAEATILLAVEGTTLHADVAHRRVRFYKDIPSLRRVLRQELERLSQAQAKVARHATRRSPGRGV